MSCSPAGDQLEPPRELEPQRAEHLRGDGRGVGDDQQQIAGPGVQRAADRVGLTRGQELRDRRAPCRLGGIAVLHERPDEPLGAVLLGHLGQLIEILARQLARAGVDPAHDPAARQRAGEDLELAVGDRRTEIAQLQPEAGVGTIGAEPADGLGVGHPRPRRRRHVEPGAPEDLADRRLGGLEHVVLLDERQLDVELGELGQPVGAGVLVAKAADDLVVALKAADHQQLLEQLRRLRQRVERPGRDPRRDEEVTRALGRRARQERRLDLQEVAGVEHLADRAHDLVAQRDRLLASAPGAGPASDGAAAGPR